MHASVYEFCRDVIKRESIAGRRVLEVGSLNVNGSIRTLICPYRPREYIGVDIQSGVDVDVVCDAEDLVENFGRNSFDIVLCLEMLEHAKSWATVIDQMKNVLRCGGFLCLTTRSRPFHYHGYPHDYWRFNIKNMREIFEDMAIVDLRKDWLEPGVFLLAEKRDEQYLTSYKHINVYAMRQKLK